MFDAPGRIGMLGGASSGGLIQFVDDAKLYLNGIAPYHYWDFIQNRAVFAGRTVGALADTPGWTFSRASTGYAQDSAGLLASFASGAPRITDKGILIENGATNLALWSNDWTNAAWTKSSVSTALTQTGPDGVANSATLLTATGANGTVLQSITSASANRYGSVWIKRITGSGNIDTTLDGGTAWTTIAVTSSWLQLGKAQATVTNPNFGLRIVTSGDAVAVWCGQVESADFPTSPIPTTTASATRAVDSLTISSPGLAYPLSLWTEFTRGVDTGVNEFVMQTDGGTTNERASLLIGTTDLASATAIAASVNQGTVTVATALSAGTTYKIAGRFNTNSMQAAKAATLGTEDTTVTLPATPSTLRIGSGTATTNKLNGYIRRAAAFNSALSDGNLTTITT